MELNTHDNKHENAYRSRANFIYVLTRNLLSLNISFSFSLPPFAISPTDRSVFPYEMNFLHEAHFTSEEILKRRIMKESR